MVIKKNLIFIIPFLIVTAGTLAQNDSEKFRYSHGPYLQEVTETGATIIFTTNKPAFSWVEVIDKSGAIRKISDSKHGMKSANNTFNTIRIDGLKGASGYSYSLVSKEITKFEPYSVKYGDSIRSGQFRFKTLNITSDKLSFIELSDMHGNNEKLAKLLKNSELNSAELVIYCGDMVDYLAKEDQPFTGFIDKSVELFAGEKPMIYTRGNHETRGLYSRTMFNYFPRSDNRFYYAFRQGPVFFIILDSGEDKEDTHPVYAGLNSFDQYRADQAEWLKEIVRSKEFIKAPYRIVISHIPPDSGSKWHGESEVSRLWLPILNKARVSLMLCGHQHRYSYNLPGKMGNSFPILIGSNNSAARIDADKKQIAIKVVSTDGKALDNILIRK
jgi:acid phosphatase type 7